MLLGFITLVIWFAVRCIRRSEDPTKIIVKIIASFVAAGLVWFVLLRNIEGSSALLLPIIGLTLGGIGAVLWAPHLAALAAKPFTALFDGGNQEVVPEAVYSIATAKRKMGKYQEALAEIRKQLDMFPNDITGQMMQAEIQAENLNDLQGAELTVQRLCNQPGHAPNSIALALNTVADWHLKYAQDKEAARQALEKVIELFPDSPQSQMAEQRIAHLASTQDLLDLHERATIEMKEGVQNVGLMKDSSVLRKAEKDPAEEAAEYVQHLEKYPNDNEAREKLATIYSEHYQRADLAIEQLEQLIQQPNQPAKEVARWVNLIADTQMKHGASHEEIKATLERIIDLYPARAYAEHARQRIEVLKLQMKARESSQGVQLGTYEQNIGLKKKT